MLSRALDVRMTSHPLSYASSYGVYRRLPT